MLTPIYLLKYRLFRLQGASLITGANIHNHSIPVYGRASGGASSKTEQKKETSLYQIKLRGSLNIAKKYSIIVDGFDA